MFIARLSFDFYYERKKEPFLFNKNIYFFYFYNYDCNILAIFFLFISLGSGDLDLGEESLLSAQQYEALITRDLWGVPHIQGKRDRDVAFGLAYAHAEDDIENIMSNLYLYRAQMGLKEGFEGAVTDYLIKALGVREKVALRYSSELSPEVRKVVEAYTAGLNYWASLNPDNQFVNHFPVKKEDIVAGFFIQNLFFSGVISSIEKLQKGEALSKERTVKNKKSLFDWKELILGSNAFALRPSKTGDGSTRLMINSHQPLEGPVAWYEAHLKSEEGWNMMGGLFPGSPFILVGFNENLGWGLTVNKPDLSDAYLLKINPDDPDQYLLDGEWRNFRKKNIKLPTKIWGPFWWTFHREAKYSIHGPILETDYGTYAIRFSGMNDIKQVEQWYKLNKSKNLDEWLSAMKQRSIVSFNAVYADKESNILFLHNSTSPIRKTNIDWERPVDGTDSSLIWEKIVPLEQLPLLINPKSGWLVSTNQNPFRVTSQESNLNPQNYLPSTGLQTRMTNRANRAIELFSKLENISEDKFKAIKFDNAYSKDSRAYKYLTKILEYNFVNDNLINAQNLLKNWNLQTDFGNRSATLGVCVISPEWLAEQRQSPPPNPIKVFEDCVKKITKTYGRLNPLWSERNFLIRGSKKLSVQGGPDTLRAIYGREQKEGYLKASAGDGLYIYVEWDKQGNLKSESVHQYGSATQDEKSSHYNDQMELFVGERMKDTFYYTFELKDNIESKLTVPFH